MTSTFIENCVIRRAKIEDCEQILALIQEQDTTCTTKTAITSRLEFVETLRKDGFGEEPLFHCFVAVASDDDSADTCIHDRSGDNSCKAKLLGCAIYLDYYAEYHGPYVFLENIYVSARYKGQGVEEKLLRAVARVAVRNPAVSMTWTRSRGQRDSNVIREPAGTVNRTLQQDTVGFQVLEDRLKSIAASGRDTDGGIIIREARPDDCEQIVELMKGLAIHERSQTSVVQQTPDDLRRDGFGPCKLYHCYVADDNGRLAGHTLHVLHYSARDRVSIFLQDLYVLADYRGRGVGSRLFQALAKEALQRGCTRMMWTAYAWNKEAMAFYAGKRAINTSEQFETHYMSLSGDELKAFAASN